MSLTADTSPSLQACQQCSLTFPTGRELDRHVALDHTGDADGADLVALITDPRSPAARPAPSPSGTQEHQDPPQGSAASPPWWRMSRAQLLVALYGLATLYASSPLLVSSLVVVVACVVAWRLRDRIWAWGQQPPTAPPRPGPHD